MALTFTKHFPSGTSNGQLLPVVAVASPGTLFHQVKANLATDAREMIYLDAVNTATAARILNVEFGSTGTEDFFNVTLNPNEGVNRIIAGWVLGATATGVVRLFATATGDIRVGGWINRAT